MHTQKKSSEQQSDNGKTNLVIKNNGEVEAIIMQDEQESFHVELYNNVTVTQTIMVNLNTKPRELSGTDDKEALVSP